MRWIAFMLGVGRIVVSGGSAALARVEERACSTLPASRGNTELGIFAGNQNPFMMETFPIYTRRYCILNINITIKCPLTPLSSWYHLSKMCIHSYVIALPFSEAHKAGTQH